MAARYTHVKVLNEKIDNAVGYVLGLITTGTVPYDAWKSAQLKFGLEVIDVLLCQQKYPSVFLTYSSNPDPKQKSVKAIADYTIAEIEAKQLAEYQKNQAAMQPQVDKANAKFADEQAAKENAIAISTRATDEQKESILAEKKAAAQARIDEKKAAKK